MTREGRELPQLLFKGQAIFYVLHNKGYHPLGSIVSVILYELS